jgi:diguanylate cyclase (GGDEF)-like protein
VREALTMRFKLRRSEVDLKSMVLDDPLARQHVLRRLMPFVLAAALPFLLAPLPPANWRIEEVAMAALITLVIGVTAVAVSWKGLPSWAHLIPSLGYLGAVALLRDAGGGTNAGVGALVLLPVVWMALYGSRTVLLITLAAVAATFFLPILLIGSPTYSPLGWRTGTLLTVVAAIIGLTVHALINRVRAGSRQRDVLLERLDALAHTDGLTGLPNRRAWEARLAEALAHARQAHRPLTVAMIDFDAFKAINDVHGHDAGDRLLREAAAAWHGQLRDGDVLARLGGDEFVVMFPGADLVAAGRIAERIRRHTPGANTVSIGLAAHQVADDAQALLRRADAALYAAKRHGRDRVELPAGVA